MTASSPPTAVLKVMATRGAISGVIFRPARLQGPVDHEHGMRKDRRGPVGHLARGEEGIGRASTPPTWPAIRTGKPSPERETGQRADAAFPADGALPLAFQLGSERGNDVVSEDPGRRSAMFLIRKKLMFS